MLHNFVHFENHIFFFNALLCQIRFTKKQSYKMLKITADFSIHNGQDIMLMAGTLSGRMVVYLQAHANLSM